MALTGFTPGQASATVATDEQGVTTERVRLPFRLKLDTNGRTISGATLCRLAIPPLTGQLVPGLGVCTEATDGNATEGHAWAFTFVRLTPEAEAAAEDSDGYEDDYAEDDEPEAQPAFTDRSLEAAYDESR